MQYLKGKSFGSRPKAFLILEKVLFPPKCPHEQKNNLA